MNKKYMIVQIEKIVSISENTTSMITQSCFEIVKKDFTSLKDAREEISTAAYPSLYIVVPYF